MMHEYITVLIASMLPILELRGAIPLGIGVYDLNPLWIYIIAVLGNMFPILFLLWFWDKGAAIVAARFKPFDTLIQWLFNRTRKKFYENHKRFGQWALLIFVAIPLPVTGAWTGSVAAWLFGIPYKRAIALIFGGVLISGVIVTLLTLGIIEIV